MPLHAQKCVTAATHTICVCVAASRSKREGALQLMKALVNYAGDAPWLPRAIKQDLKYALRLIAQAVTSSSWVRNAAWIVKFRNYVFDNCRDLMSRVGAKRVLTSKTIATAYLANVVREDPMAFTRVDSAKQAINLLRAIANVAPLDDNVTVRYLSRGARNAIVRTKKQSPALLAIYVAAIVRTWGRSRIWWKRQVALMILISFCTLARGAGMVSCLREGYAWVRKDGTLVNNSLSFTPQQSCNAKQCSHPACVRGFLILFPGRKNRRNSPSWIPVAEMNAVAMMARHLRWLRHAHKGRFMFPARKRTRRRNVDGKVDISWAPNTSRNSQMSTASFRALIRQALVECCNLTEQQASRFGTHSPKIGSVEELRKCGVPAELRQQLGAWMSQSVALMYMQLEHNAQFDVLEQL